MNSFLSTNLCYLLIAANVITVGRQLALLLFEMMNLKKVRAKDIHLVGHSLGAQVAHQTSKWLRHLTKSDSQPEGSRPGRITGLDPAAPYFQGHPGTHLVKEDADFVDVIHTSIATASIPDPLYCFITGQFGMSEAVGSVDFFPNGGTNPQPSCYSALSPCSHNKALEYFARSLANNRSQAHGLDEAVFPSSPCGTESRFLDADTSGSSMGMQAVNFTGRGLQCLQT